MSCYYPLDGWRSKNPNERGKYPVVFVHSDAQLDQPVKIACGQCIGCRLERSRQWAMRCVNESTLHANNAFITLTYNDDHLPSDESLHKSHWQDFAKRLRHHLHPTKIRYFMCGEYGSDQDPTTTRTIGRPHYHAIIFGYNFPDQVQIAPELFHSQQLENIWGKGYCTVGDVTFESSAYVARYVMKKINGDEAEEHYQIADNITGEITNIHPEFTNCSRRPGIGREWFEKYRHDLDKGFVTMRGIKMPPPKYYDDLYKENHQEDYEYIAENRRINYNPYDWEKTNNRLRVKEKLKLAQIKTLKRSL